MSMTAHSKHMLCRVSSVPACVFYIWKLHTIIHDLQYGTSVDRSTHTWERSICLPWVIIKRSFHHLMNSRSQKENIIVVLFCHVERGPPNDANICHSYKLTE